MQACSGTAELMTMGTCLSDALFIATEEECEAAAVSLGLSDVTASVMQNVNLPHGCYRSGSGRLYLNEAGDRHDGGTIDLAICTPGPQYGTPRGLVAGSRLLPVPPLVPVRPTATEPRPLAQVRR